MKKFIAFLLPLVIGCQNNDQDRTGIAEKESRAQQLQFKILGQWGGLKESSPVWEIRPDSIYYFQESRAYAYQLIDSNLIIERFNTKAILSNISIINDTMTFSDEPGSKIQAFRFKGKVDH